MSSRFPEGSLWRRWDLHIHTPGTALNNQFDTEELEDYLDALEQTAIPAAVLGITDYCSIRNYKRVLSSKQAGRLSAVRMLLPNIEFRVVPETKNRKGVNLHLLVSPVENDHVERIEEALGALKIKYKGEDIRCTESGLTRLGQLHDASQTDSQGQFRLGVGQFKPGFEVIRAWLEDEQWLRRNSLVALSTGEDGLKGLTHDGGLAAYRDELIRMADLLFSSKESDRLYWLGKAADSVEVLERKYGGCKPCVSGSDAHALSAISSPEHERYCWVKADPTFEGLRQILYEPEDRVWVGPSPPSRHDEELILESIELRSANDWFEETKIPLNPGLVAVIGSRGSGKTALADLVAYSSGARVDPQASFIGRALATHQSVGLSGMDLCLRWASGRQNRYTVDEEGLRNPSEEPEVKYLSQKFVEQLCSGDREANELRREIEAVVFESLDDLQRDGTTSFQELLDVKTSGIKNDMRSVQGEIISLNQAISELDSRRRRFSDLTKQEANLVRQIDAKKKQLPKIDNEADIARAEAIKKLIERQQVLEAESTRLSRRRQTILDLERASRRFADQMESFWQDFISRLEEASVAKKKFTDVRPTFGEDPLPLLRAEVEDLEARIRLLQKDPSETGGATRETLSSVALQIEKLREQLKLDRQKRDVFNKLQVEEQKLEKELETVREEIVFIKEKLPQERVRLSNRRSKLYDQYFTYLGEEQEVLEDIFGPLHQRLQDSDESEQQVLEVYIRREVNLQEWVVRGESLFDRRSVLTVDDELIGLAHVHLLQSWLSGDSTGAQTGIKKIIEHLQQGPSDISAKLKSGKELRDVADWLFSLEHIQLYYDIRYDGTELDKLSPGTKGIVLLILFLALDTNDQRPLLIDQPEENLDNQSIFQLLIGYFKAAKQRRQVILITHNPNLVVNTDADQVVVATSERREGGLPRISYRSGSLEATEREDLLGGSVRNAIIDILEGGREAFRMRERKLGFLSLRDKNA